MNVQQYLNDPFGATEWIWKRAHIEQYQVKLIKSFIKLDWV